MAFEVEYTDEFEECWNSLKEAEQDSVEWSVDLLSSEGPALSRPHVDTLNGCRFPNLKELRVQHEGRPYRVFFAFDPRRMAMLLIGGDKTGNNKFYEEMVPKAEAIYAQHLVKIESK
jgi:hypothetical protein